MKYKQLIINNKIFYNDIEISKILNDIGFNWLVNSETEMADIEVINNTIIWKDGNFYTGNWEYGIWENGNFWGIWENGIWKDGNFKGKFISGIDYSSHKSLI